MTYTVRPISDRTAFTGRHIRSAFDSTWTATERLLLREVKHLRGRDLVLEVDVTEGAIRLDGRLYANARPSSPAVRVAFESIHGPLTYATDKFTSWQDNVRAIALGLEALRKVDRYGITQRGEQYTGWKALPAGPGTGVAVGGMTAEQAARIISGLTEVGSRGFITAGEIQRDVHAARRAHRRAQAAAHPDRHGGDRSKWDIVEQAATVLGLS